MSLEEKENRPDLRQAYSSPFNPKALIYLRTDWQVSWLSIC